MTRTHVDLFSGIGGFALACRWLDIQTIAFCEIEPYAQQVLIKNFNALPVTDAIRCDGRTNNQSPSPSERNRTSPLEDYKGERCGEAGSKQPSPSDSPRLHGDIFQFDGTQYAGAWLLTGGFPCQPFSVAGKRRGKEDDRYLWPEMLRVITEARPHWVLAENVPGIINMELDHCISNLEDHGYTAWPIVIPACAVDARHRRDRVWIVAHDASERQGNHSQVQTGCKFSRWNSVGCGGIPVSKTGECSKFRSEPRTGIGTIQESNGKVSTNYNEPGLERKITTGVCGGESGLSIKCCEWSPEPNVGRVAHGVPRRVDRLKGLGNAIVPQVAQRIIAAMIQSEQLHDDPAIP